MANRLDDMIRNSPKAARNVYEGEVIALIRKRYTIDQENAILRKRLAGIDAGEFSEYNSYVESCKAEVKSRHGFKF